MFVNARQVLVDTSREKDFIFITEWKGGFTVSMKESKNSAILLFNDLPESEAIQFKARMDAAIAKELTLCKPNS